MLVAALIVTIVIARGVLQLACARWARARPPARLSWLALPFIGPLATRGGWTRVKGAIAVATGPLATYLIAAGLTFTVVHCAGDRIGRVDYRVIAVNEQFDAHGKLVPGDLLISIDGESTTNRHVGSMVDESGGRPIEVAFERDGRRHTIQITPARDTDGRYRMGVALDPVSQRAPTSLATSLGRSLVRPMTQAGLLVRGWWEMIVGEPESEVAGPVGVVELVERESERGWVASCEALALAAIYYFVLLVPLDLVLLFFTLTRRRSSLP